MTLSAAEHLAVLIFVVGMTGAFLACTVAVVRLRRAWRRRRYDAARSLLSLGKLGLPLPRVAAQVGGSIASPTWWLAQHDRHAMWRSVTAASRAVKVATRAGVPVGDLPALSRRLDRAASEVDAALRAAGPDRQAARRLAPQVAQIQAAARDIRAGAVDALAATGTDLESLGSLVAVETEALAAGLRAARAARQPSLS